MPKPPTKHAKIAMTPEAWEAMSKARDAVELELGFLPTWSEVICWLASGRGLAEMQWRKNVRGVARRRK